MNRHYRKSPGGKDCVAEWVLQMEVQLDQRSNERENTKRQKKKYRLQEHVTGPQTPLATHDATPRACAPRPRLCEGSMKRCLLRRNTGGGNISGWSATRQLEHGWGKDAESSQRWQRGHFREGCWAPSVRRKARAKKVRSHSLPPPQSRNSVFVTVLFGKATACCFLELTAFKSRPRLNAKDEIVHRYNRAECRPPPAGLSI